jgi:hypothetical protein
MTTQTEALKLALDALEKSDSFLYNWHENSSDDEADAYSTARQLNEKAIAAIKEVLAHPAVQQGHEQEPVGKIVDCDFVGNSIARFERHLPFGTLLYTFPPPQRTWVGLTDEDLERIKLLTFEKEINADGEEQEAVNLDQLIRAAEQLCKEKNRGQSN